MRAVAVHTQDAPGPGPFCPRRREPRKARATVLLATVETPAAQFIPYSVSGSDYDYTTGGEGTAR
jgi:hypothetical protein